MGCLGRNAVVFLGSTAVLLSASAWADPPLVVNPGQVSEATRRQVEGPVRWILLADKVEKERKRQAQAKVAAAAAERSAAEHAALQAKRVQSAPAVTPAVAAKSAPVPKTPQAVAQTAALPAAPASLPAAVLPVASIAPAAALPMPADEPEEESEPAPKLLDLVEPFISDSIKARLRGKGNIVVRFRIQPNGTVRGAEVVETSHPALRQPVLKAVEQWRYAAPGKEIVKLVQLQIDAD